MKIQDFCSRIRDDKNGIFQALRGLQEIDTQTLLDGGGTWSSWDPWTRMISPEPVSA